TMNKGFEEIYEGMRVNRENFCLECVVISEIELVHFHTVLNFLDKVTPLFFLISYVYSKVFI
ncbi:hypothetical protein, partial [Bacteroides sp. RTP21281st1_E4_RTP21281_210402]|uniref:hypothetical protein n=1 Tax=unclassified Bacteroides TaxID=2646097 RepID=UPI0034A3C9FE